MIKKSYNFLKWKKDLLGRHGSSGRASACKLKDLSSKAGTTKKKKKRDRDKLLFSPKCKYIKLVISLTTTKVLKSQNGYLCERKEGRKGEVKEKGTG